MPARCDACQHDCPGFFRSECPGGRQYLPTRERVVDLELAAAKLPLKGSRRTPTEGVTLREH